MSASLKVALLQLKGCPSKQESIANAIVHIRLAKDRGARLIILPECFNSPYSVSEFGRNAEAIPQGETSQALAKVAAELGIYLVGGSYPEKEGTKLYNTCPVFGPQGQLLCKYRKMHLFDMDIPGKCTFRESSVLTPGEGLATFTIDSLKIGLGICWDKRFAELTACYRQLGCDMMIFPSAFDPYTGPLHWDLLGRARALDNQMFVALVSPARDPTTEYVAYGYTLLCDPWGRVLCRAKEEQEMLIADIDLSMCEQIKGQIPVLSQKRADVYELKLKKC
ncbi:nitrilase and fragile histidine triad fusion protein NitFhit [Anopheles darlingi]|uniref:omega-amidase n=1 Tax=Anopheles darlingi TaxID=43151 RepID=W5J6R9_ANODA|nr:nitrilase and fragile histidine triad fusion protein NitFhit [Anopheles darlingi]